jgi:hypothetical protein
MNDRGFSAAVDRLAHAAGERDASLLEPILDVIPVTGASVSTLGELLGDETVEASDAIIRRMDELQFDFREGPCWDAVQSGAPVLEPDFRGRPRGVWPRFEEGVLEHEVGALFAVPVSLGTLHLGAIDLYHSEPMELDPEAVRRLVVFGTILGRRVLQRALESSADAIDTGTPRHSRHRIHQATGFVIAQLGVSAEDALLLIQARAYAGGSSVAEVADEILERRFAFAVSGSTIEGES